MLAFFFSEHLLCSYHWWRFLLSSHLIRRKVGILEVVEGIVMSWIKESFVVFTWLFSFVTRRCLY